VTAATGLVDRRDVSRIPARLAGVVEFLRMMSRKPVGLIGLIGVLFFLFLAYVAPLIVPLQDQVDVTAIYAKPSWTHPLGTDFQGRDVVNQIVFGGGDIITTAILAALFSTLIAITFGSIAATVGGRLDQIILAITDVALTIPRASDTFTVAPSSGTPAWERTSRTIRVSGKSASRRSNTTWARKPVTPVSRTRLPDSRSTIEPGVPPPLSTMRQIMPVYRLVDKWAIDSSAMDLPTLQVLMRETYGERDRARGSDATFRWLTEEVGELARALRKEDGANHKR